MRSDLVRRVRRSWLVTMECDPRRVAAAAVGGRVSCVSEAALRGLWTPPHDRLHVAVAPGASRFDAAGLHVHWSTGPVPLPRTAGHDHPLNMLFHVARCLPRPGALAVWESALKRGVVDAGVIGQVQWRSARARELARLSSALADSGIETIFVDLMRQIGVRVQQQVWVDGHPLDGLIGRHLAIQLDGFEHHSEAKDRRRDLRADARLVLRGYTVLRFDYQQILFDQAHVIDCVRSAIAQGLHR